MLSLLYRPKKLQYANALSTPLYIPSSLPTLLNKPTLLTSFSALSVVQTKKIAIYKFSLSCTDRPSSLPSLLHIHIFSDKSD